MSESLSIIEPLPLKPSEESLIQAIKNGNLNRLRCLITTNNISPKFKFSDGEFESLLHYAITSQYAYSLDHLDSIDSTWFFNTYSSNIAQPINAIIQFLLVEFQVSPNQTNISYKTPLHTAMINFHLNTVHLLLQHGANPNKQDKNGNTPLHEFAYNIKRCNSNQFKEKSILALLYAGTDHHIRNHKNKTAEEIAPEITPIIKNCLGLIEQNVTTRFKL